MTLKEAARLFRSLKHYERLSEGIPAKKARLICLIQQYGITRLNGYEIELDGEEILYRKLPSQPYKQLKLELGEQYMADV
jgi:hypothetical protein